MSLADHDRIILAIIFSIVGLVLLVVIISVFLWRIVQHYKSRTKRLNGMEGNPSPSISHRLQYHRSQKCLSRKSELQNKNSTKRRKRRSNTNDSAITLSFNPPHLINQNVKNLEKLLQNESTLTANSWLYEETLPKKTCFHINSSNEPIYTSSSTVLTSVSNLAVLPSQMHHTSFHYLSELDQVLRVKHPLKYSQSCRQTTDSLPFDYCRSISPPSTIASKNNSLEPIYIRTNKASNATLMRKARLAQLRDDTAILY